MLKRIVAAASVGLVALGMSGCSSSSEKAEAPADKITVFATTNVWGSVVKHIGGDKVKVEEGVTRPDQDPHDYEATAQDKLKASKAQVVVVNGGGYDDWGTKLAESAKDKPVIIDAVKLSGLQKEEAAEGEGDHGHDQGAEAEKGHDHGAEAEKGHDHDHGAEQGHDHGAEGEKGHHHHHHGSFNEHVFYSLPTIKKVGDALTKELSAKDKANAKTYEQNNKKFQGEIDKLEKAAAKHKETVKHVHVVATEPVVGYLLEAMGMHDVTPEEYVEQSETEAGPSTKVIDETKNLLTSGEAKGLILNGQTEDKVSDQLKKTAEEKKLPVVKVYETFPEGTTDIVVWIDKAIKDLSAIK